jgi:pyrroloquinoline quinone biosynthesis protein D
MTFADAWQGRPRLVARARLRRDRHSGGYLLVYPERGLLLNETAAAIVRCCTGELRTAEIVDALVARYAAPRETIERGVASLLDALAARALLEWETS